MARTATTRQASAQDHYIQDVLRSSAEPSETVADSDPATRPDPARSARQDRALPDARAQPSCRPVAIRSRWSISRAVSTLPGMRAVDEYLATLDDAARSAYERIRDVALAEVPGAEQGISYGMAALKYRGKPLLGFRAAKDHLSVFPFSPAAMEAVKEELRGDAASKGTVRFSPDQPLPDSIVVGLVRSRAAEIDTAR
jgi:uncharacterized protein YdhG (YjbR/CyaY superfamily)